VREEVSISPSVWLSSPPIPITHAPSVLATFKPGTVKVVRFVGPHKLYRAAGWDATKDSLASSYGSWWADERVLAGIGARISKFDNWLPKDLLKRAWPAQYRGAAALCYDWNDMREMFSLQLPSGQELTGLAGLAAPQPMKSTLNPASRKTPMLEGGGEQVFFKKTPTLSSINPLWVYPEYLW